MFKKLDIRGVSHHFLLPIIAVLVVGGIGGVIMQRSSSAATKCRNRTFSIGARSECVRYAQYMIGTSHDGVFGNNTRAKLKQKTGQTSLNSAAWGKLCARGYSAAINKQRDAACKGGQYVKALGNPTVGYKVCKHLNYKSPAQVSYMVRPSKPTCSGWVKYTGVGAKSRATARKSKTNYSSVMKQYKKDNNAYKAYIRNSPTLSKSQKSSKIKLADYAVQNAEKSCNIKSFQPSF